MKPIANEGNFQDLLRTGIDVSDDNLQTKTFKPSLNILNILPKTLSILTGA